MTEAFFDSNVLLYLTSDDLARAGPAEAVLATGGTISLQVLDEFAAVAVRKFRMPWVEVRDFLTIFKSNLILTPTTLQTHELGLRLAEGYRYSVYDSMLLAAALQAGCTTFWSEDLHDGQVIENTLTIRNPFARGAAE